MSDSLSSKGLLAVPGDNAISTLSTGAFHSCAIKSDQKVYCWGENISGQLGFSFHGSVSSPNLVEGLTQVQQISAGEGGSCAIDASQNLYCWGDVGGGELGESLGSGRSGPKRVLGMDRVVQVVAGFSFYCAIRLDRTVHCWGENSRGQLGDGTRVARTTPVQVKGLNNIVSIGLARQMGCALRDDGKVLCWGNMNFSDPLDAGSPSDYLEAKLIPILSNIKQLSIRWLNVCFLKNNGEVYCWGNSFTGPDPYLKTEEPMSNARKTEGLTDVVKIAAGAFHTCALNKKGEVFCWGDNDQGELGDGSQVSHAHPSQVLGLSGVSEIYGGSSFSCAVKSDHSGYCWGMNGQGQLGDGTSQVFRTTPTRILNLD